MSKCKHTNREPYESYSGTVTMYSCQDCEAFVSLGQHEWMKRAEKAEAEVERLSKRQKEDEAAFWEERDARVETQAKLEKLREIGDKMYDELVFILDNEYSADWNLEQVAKEWKQAKAEGENK